MPDESFDRAKRHTDFIKTAIFPGGCLPSVAALTRGRDQRGLSLAHLDDIGLHYAETLRRWRENLVDAGDDLDASASTSDSCGSGSSTSPTARPRSTSATRASCSCCTRRPAGCRAPSRPHDAVPPALGPERGTHVTPRRAGRRTDLTLQEAADLLGVHYMTAYRYVRTGRLAASQVGSSRGTFVAESRQDREPQVPGRAKLGVTPRRHHYERRLTDRLVQGDESESWRVTQQALASAFTPRISTSRCSVRRSRVGDEWAAGRLTVADEHRATCGDGALVGRLGPSLVRRGPTRGLVVLGAPGATLTGSRPRSSPIHYAAAAIRSPISAPTHPPPRGRMPSPVRSASSESASSCRHRSTTR